MISIQFPNYFKMVKYWMLFNYINKEAILNFSIIDFIQNHTIYRGEFYVQIIVS